MGIYQGVAYLAAQTAPATDMGVILGLIPLTSALCAGVLSGELLTGRRVGGALLSLAGLVLLATKGKPWDFAAGGFQIGDALILLAVLSNALYSSLLKRWGLPLEHWEQLLAQIAFGVLLTFPLWLVGPKTPITSENLPLIFYAGIPASIGAPFFWLRGVKDWGAARAAQFMNLIPLSVALGAWIMLGETPFWYHAVGGKPRLGRRGDRSEETSVVEEFASVGSRGHLDLITRAVVRCGRARDSLQ
jgi:drug/metabolite transporter (DMT)-like permease